MAHDFETTISGKKPAEPKKPSSDPSKADTRENLDTTFGNPEKQ